MLYILLKKLFSSCFNSAFLKSISSCIVCFLLVKLVVFNYATKVLLFFDMTKLFDRKIALDFILFHFVKSGPQNCIRFHIFLKLFCYMEKKQYLCSGKTINLRLLIWLLVKVAYQERRVACEGRPFFLYPFFLYNNNYFSII